LENAEDLTGKVHESMSGFRVAQDCAQDAMRLVRRGARRMEDEMPVIEASIWDWIDLKRTFDAYAGHQRHVHEPRIVVFC